MNFDDLRSFIRTTLSDPTSDRLQLNRALVLGRRLAGHIARDLGLPTDSFDVREDAENGAVVLHAEHLCVTLGGYGHGFTFRSCSGRDDFDGGCANWLPYKSLLNDYEETLRMFRGTMELASAMSAAL